MPSKIARIRNLIKRQQYEMSAHAKVEMAEDKLDIVDVKNVVFNGRIVRYEKDDVRGTKYIVEGLATDQMTPVRVVGRFTSTGRYLIITVYEVTEL